MSKYLGTEKIHTLEDVSEDEVKIVLKDQTVYLLPKILVEKMVFNEPVKVEGLDGRNADEDFQAWKLSTVANDLVNLFTKVYRLRHKEVETLLAFIQNKVNNDYNLAQMLLWGKGHYEITLQDIRDVSDKAAKEELDKAKENNKILQTDLQHRKVQRGR